MANGETLSCDGAERLDTTETAYFTEVRQGESIRGFLTIDQRTLLFQYTWRGVRYDDLVWEEVSADGQTLTLIYFGDGYRYKKVWQRDG